MHLWSMMHVPCWKPAVHCDRLFVSSLFHRVQTKVMIMILMMITILWNVKYLWNSVLLQLRPFPNFLGSLIHISVSDIFLVDWISGKCFIPTSWLGCCCSILQQTWQRYICTHLWHTWCWPKVCWKKQTKCIKIWSCDYKTLQTVFQR